MAVAAVGGHALEDRLPGRRLVVGPFRRAVEQQHPELDGGDAVDHRVVDLAEQRRSAVAHPRDDGDLPEGAVPRQLPG